MDATDYPPKFGPNTPQWACPFSVSKKNTDHLRAVNTRKGVVCSAELGDSETPEMGHGASQTGACGLATRAPHLLDPVSQPPLSFLIGTWPNITRNAIVNCAEMVTYDVIKEKLLDYHLFTGEARSPWQAASHSREGTCSSTWSAPPRGSWALERAERKAAASTSL